MTSILKEFETLSDDDEIAFLELVQRYQNYLNNVILNADDRTDIIHAHLSFMNKVIAAASEFGIDQFSAWKLPSRNLALSEFNDFSFKLDRYITGVTIRKSRIVKIYSVELDDNTKKRIHFLVQQIRDSLGKVDIEERKKNSLFSKLNAFDADVDKARTSFNNAYLMGIDVAHLAKKFGEALNPVTDLVKSINELLGAAKDGEPDRQQLPPPAEKKSLEPPVKQIEGPQSRDLDNEIPF